MSLDRILDQLRHAEDEIDRAKAAEWLGNYEGEQVVEALIEAMADDQLVAVAAMESLKKCRPDPGPYLRHVLRDTNLSIRWGAVGLLAYFPSPETEVALRGALEDESSHVRGNPVRIQSNSEEGET